MKSSAMASKALLYIGLAVGVIGISKITFQKAQSQHQQLNKEHFHHPQD
jgi:hypothetical protein